MTEQKIQRTLQIKNGLQEWEYTTVWQLLGDNAALYGNNGGDADGDALLPVIPLDESDEGVQAVLDAGYGEMVRAVYTDARDIMRLEAWDDETALAWLDDAENDEIYEAARGIVSNISNGWAGFPGFLGGETVVYRVFDS